jgi:hypothetical protein
MDEDILSKARDFWKFSIVQGNAHYLASETFGARNRWLGIPVTIMTAVVGTAIFATLSRANTIQWLAIATGMLSITAAVLSSLQTFLRFSELSAAHKNAGTSYDEVRRALDLFFLRFGREPDREAAIKRLEEISKNLDAIAKAAPTIPDRIYDAANKDRKWGTSPSN